MKKCFGIIFALCASAFCSSTVQGKIKELQVYSTNNSEKPNACTVGNSYVMLDNGGTYWHAASGGEVNNPVLNLLIEAYSDNQTVKLEVEDSGSNCAPSNFKKIISVKLVRN